MTTTAETPAWSVDSQTGHSGSNDRFTWTSHYGDTIKLVTPGDNGDVVAEGLLFQFEETGEPTQLFLRILGADDSDVDHDLTAEQADEFLARAEQWIAGLRALRALMDGAQ